MEIFQLLFKHGTQLIEALTLLHAAALIIVNVTPTPRDNEFLEGATGRVQGFYRLIEMAAGIFNTRKVKG